jgi:eukaryotic-like serine/threonine-protein kinase
MESLLAANGSVAIEDVPTLRLRKPAVLSDLYAPMEPLEAAARSFQDFHQNHEAEGADAVAGWCLSFPGRREHAHLFGDLYREDPQAARRLAEAAVSMPEAGAEFLGFHLLAELGRGALGRVFLARQDQLAGRHVAIKVAADVWGESQSLAQLQHPNIVPIYSVHRRDPFQVVCMPFLGSATLRDVVRVVGAMATMPTSGRVLVQVFGEHRSTDGCSALPADPADMRRDESASPRLADALAGLSYVEAVVCLAARLADGLAHAHEHGIIHRDLKPANILLTDDGQPMLLDFNVAADTKRRAGGMIDWAAGTLPYMAPEHLCAFEGDPVPIDARCDIYAFGIVLFELLTGRYPFKVPEDRRVSPGLRHLNHAVSPALEAIVRRCLEPAPNHRYQSARELHEDLERQRTHRPLKHTREPSVRERLGKWARRHPRLVPACVVSVLAFTLLAGFGAFFTIRDHRAQAWRQQEEERIRSQELREQARARWQQFQEDRKAAQFFLYTRTNEPDQLAQGIEIGSRLIDSYDALEDAEWRQQPAVQALPVAEQQQLGDAAAELLFLLARAALLQNRPVVGGATSKTALETALRMNERAAGCSPAVAASPALWRQRAALGAALGRLDDARDSHARANALPLRTAEDHYWSASDHLAAGELRTALPLLQQATQLEPQNFWAWFVLANCYERLGNESRAEASYAACIALWPRFHWTYFNRGLAFLRQKDYRQAVADFDKMISLRPEITETYLNRALAYQGLREYAKADGDLTEALERGSSSSRLFFMRSRVRAQRADKEGARRDFEEGLRRTPADEQSWSTRGFAFLSRDPKAALADFEQALRLNPRSPAGLQNKAHVLAERLGRTEEALHVLDKAIKLYPDSAATRGGRGVLLARLGRRAAALRDAEETLLRDTKAPTLYQVACIYALTSARHAEDRLRAFQLLSSAFRQGYGLDLLEHDQDLNALRDQAEFHRLAAAARALRNTMPNPTGSHKEVTR